MSGFSPEWLALREPADDAARADALLARLPARDGALAVVDLGAGSGANLRYLAPRLGRAQRWRLVDHDARLLAAVEPATRAWAAARDAVVARRAGELALRGRDYDCLIRRERHDLVALERLDVPHGALVTSSALLDLVSGAWLESLAATCRAADATVLFALTYDGRVACTPEEHEDREVVELVNRHQLGDKGFGPALGPGAGEAAARAFQGAGFEVTFARSDWRLAGEHGALQSALLDGWLAAALELAPGRRAALTDWRARRERHVERGRSTIAVGHVDLLGLRAVTAPGSGRYRTRHNVPAGADGGSAAARRSQS